MKVRTTTILGFAKLWLMARLRPLRRLGYGFKEQQVLVEEWLDLVRRAAARDQGLAVEVAKSGRRVRSLAPRTRLGANRRLDPIRRRDAARRLNRRGGNAA